MGGPGTRTIGPRRVGMASAAPAGPIPVREAIACRAPASRVGWTRQVIEKPPAPKQRPTPSMRAYEPRGTRSSPAAATATGGLATGSTMIPGPAGLASAQTTRTSFASTSAPVALATWNRIVSPGRTDRRSAYPVNGSMVMGSWTIGDWLLGSGVGAGRMIAGTPAIRPHSPRPARPGRSSRRPPAVRLLTNSSFGIQNTSNQAMDSRFRGNDVISARHVTFTLAVAVWPSFPRKRESISVSESRKSSHQQPLAESPDGSFPGISALHTLRAPGTNWPVLMQTTS